MNECFLDTNILVYAKDQASQYYQWCVDVIEGPQQCFISSKNLSEYFAVVTKGKQSLLSIEEACADLEEFAANFEVLYPNEISLYKLLELTKKYGPKGLVIHDFEMAAIALGNGITQLATINSKDFKKIEELDLVYPQ